MTKEKIKEYNELNDKLVKASKKFIFTFAAAILLLFLSTLFAGSWLFWLFAIGGILGILLDIYFSHDAIRYSWKFYKFTKENND